MFAKVSAADERASLSDDMLSARASVCSTQGTYGRIRTHKDTRGASMTYKDTIRTLKDTYGDARTHEDT